MKRVKQKILIVIVILQLAMLAMIIPVFVDAVRIDPVEDLTANSARANTAQLKWKNEKPCSYYLISVRCDGKKYGKKFYKTEKTGRVYSDLPGGHEYKFYVWTIRNGRKSGCRTASIYVEKNIFAPEIDGKSDGYRRIDLSWNPVKEADGYTIKETNVATGEVSKKDVEADVTSISYYDKAAGGTYQYEIQSFSGKKDKRESSDWSGSVTVTAKGTIIGQASSDKDKKAGDSSGREVATAAWDYSSSSSSFKNWTYVFRLKDKEKALEAADMMEKAIANNNIGYCSMGNKTYGKNACQKLAAKVDYDLSKITTKTGCSCGDIVTLCIKYTGTDCPYEGSGPALAKALLARSDDFECFSDAEHVASDAYLERGDILISAHSNGRNNHVCMVL